MMLQDILTGINSEATAAVDKFFANQDTERILWYPSSGDDYRDVLEFYSSRMLCHDFHVSPPNIFIQTNYNAKWINYKNTEVRKNACDLVFECGDVLFEDVRTVVEVVTSHDSTF